MKRFLIVTLVFAIMIILSLSGCTKTENPSVIKETSIIETNITPSLTSLTEKPSETTQEITAPTAIEIIFSSSSSDKSIIYIYIYM